MEFWGIEVKPGQTVKCEPGNERVLHLSQASLGENKKEKGSENVQVFVKFNDQKLVIGTLSSEKCAQIPYDIIFEKEFELSHGSKSTSVFFVGYRSVYQGYESGDDLDDSSSEDELEIGKKLNGKPSKTEPGKSTSEKVGLAKDDNEANVKLKFKDGKPKKEPVKVEIKGEDKDADDSDDDEDDSEEDSDEDEDIIEAMGDSSEEDEDDSSEEEATPVKEESPKKRKSGSSQIPISDKKARVVTPAQNQKTGGDGKKGGHVHIATPYPSKQGGKPQQTPKSIGSASCKSCNRNFISEIALQAHNKAKHSAK